MASPLAAVTAYLATIAGDQRAGPATEPGHPRSGSAKEVSHTAGMRPAVHLPARVTRSDRNPQRGNKSCVPRISITQLK